MGWNDADAGGGYGADRTSDYSGGLGSSGSSHSYSPDPLGGEGQYNNATVWHEIDRVVWDGTGSPPHVDGEVYSGQPTSGRAYWRKTTETYIATILDPTQAAADLLIQGATQNTVRAYVEANNLPDGEYEVRVRRTTSPSDEISVVDAVYWSQLQEIIYDDFSYPGTALMGLRIDASDQISGGRPTVSVIVDRVGIDDGISFTGGWSAGYQITLLDGQNKKYGTFWKEVDWLTDPSSTLKTEGEAYTSPYTDRSGISWRYIPSNSSRERDANNPAWAAWDILHNEEYGASVPYSQLNHEAFVKWSHWCNLRELTCNIYFDQGVSVAEALRYIGNCGRGSVTMMGTTYTVLFDKPEDVSVQTFMLGEGSIIADSFTEDYLPTTDRANSIEVTYYDKDLDYTRQMVEVYDEFYDDVEHLINKTSVNLLGCTDRDMAIAYARYSLLKNRLLTKTVTFRASTDAIGCMPGQVIDVSSDVPLIKRSGRLLSADAGGVTLDRPVTMDIGKEYAVKIRYMDDTQKMYTIRNPNVEQPTSRVEFTSEITNIPDQYCAYHFAEVGDIDNFYRVLSITRADDQTRTIRAIEYIPEIYLDQLPSEIGEVTGDVRAVRNVEASEVWALGKDGSGHSTIKVSWDGFAYKWGVFLREHSEDDSLNWVKIGDATTREYTIDRDLTIGKVYDVGISVFGTPNTEDIVTLGIGGKLAPPSDVTGFQAVKDGEYLRFTWRHISDIDKLGYIIRMGDTWDQGITIVDQVQENSATWRPAETGVYKCWIKAIDTSGKLSVNATLANGQFTDTIPINVIESHDEVLADPTTVYYHNMLPLNDKIYWIPALVDTDDIVSELTDTDIEQLRDYGGSNTRGVIISPDYDLGTEIPFQLRMASHQYSIARYVTDQSYPDRVDTDYPLDLDTLITSSSSYSMYYNTDEERLVPDNLYDNLDFPERTNLTFPDDTNLFISNPDTYWIEYKEVHAVKADKIRFMYVAETDSPSTYYYWDKCLNVMDVPDVEAQLYDQVIPSTGKVYQLADLPVNFQVKYLVNIDVTSNGPLLASVTKEKTQFTVNLFSVTGTPAEGTVDIRIKGY